MARRKTAEDYYALANSRSIKWLGTQVPEVTNTKTLWECEYEHQWLTTYQTLRQGRKPYKYSGCRDCNRNRLRGMPLWFTDEDAYRHIAERLGIKWIGDVLPEEFESSPALFKTKWECPKGHWWWSSYNTIRFVPVDRITKGCPTCWDAMRREKWGRNRIAYDDYMRIAKENGYEYLGHKIPKRTDAQEKKWQCVKCEYKKKSCYQDVRRGVGCPECYRIADRSAQVRLTAKDYHRTANEKGLEWIGTGVPINVHTKTKWRCKSNRCEYDTRYSIIKEGVGCARCQHFVNGARTSNPQRKIAEIVNGKLNYVLGSHRIDCALVKEKIGIEYDSYYIHGERGAEDKHRNSMILDLGWKLLVIKGNSKVPTRRHLEKAIEKLKLTDRHFYVMTLKDWGIGNTISEVHRSSR